MKKKLSSFESAFAAARKGGKTEFSFGGKKFNTKVKGESKGSGKVVNLPSKGPVPNARPTSGDRLAERMNVTPPARSNPELQSKLIAKNKPLTQSARTKFPEGIKMSEEAKNPANRPVQKKKISFKGNVQGGPAAKKQDRLK